MSRVVKLALVTVPVIVGIGFLMGQISNSGYGNPWFDQLTKPAAMPPGWAFGAAWTAIYAMMGVALAMVLAAPEGKTRHAALILFAVQLALNYSWSPVFFGLHQLLFGLVIIVALLLMTIATARMFGKVSRPAGWLLVPYVGWLCFATYLNFEILRLNPGA